MPNSTEEYSIGQTLEKNNFFQKKKISSQNCQTSRKKKSGSNPSLHFLPLWSARLTEETNPFHSPKKSGKTPGKIIYFGGQFGSEALLLLLLLLLLLHVQKGRQIYGYCVFLCPLSLKLKALLETPLSTGASVVSLVFVFLYFCKKYLTYFTTVYCLFHHTLKRIEVFGLPIWGRRRKGQTYLYLFLDYSIHSWFQNFIQQDQQPFVSSLFSD